VSDRASKGVATHCNTLLRTATRCSALHHTSTHCNTPVHVAQFQKKADERTRKIERIGEIEMIERERERDKKRPKIERERERERKG